MAAIDPKLTLAIHRTVKFASDGATLWGEVWGKRGVSSEKRLKKNVLGDLVRQTPAPPTLSR